MEADGLTGPLKGTDFNTQGIRQPVGIGII
jgi:hypothetical protein